MIHVTFVGGPHDGQVRSIPDDTPPDTITQTAVHWGHARRHVYVRDCHFGCGGAHCHEYRYFGQELAN